MTGAEAEDRACALLERRGLRLLARNVRSRRGGIDLVMRDGVVVEFAQDVKACALGQASAAVLGGVVIGRSVPELVQARDALRAMLKTEGPVPVAPFDGFEVLRPAREFKNRHASILLALEATVEAAEKAGAAEDA